jgi:hypothetical protein
MKRNPSILSRVAVSLVGGFVIFLVTLFVNGFQLLWLNGSPIPSGSTQQTFFATADQIPDKLPFCLVLGFGFALCCLYMTFRKKNHDT